VHNVFSADLLPLFKNEKDKGVLNGMVTNELGMGIASIYDFGETGEDVSF